MEAVAAQVEGTAQKSQSKPAGKQVQDVGSVRSRPLAGKSFYLDLPSGKKLEFLAKCVKRLGGVVESFLSKEVMCVVSSSQEARKERWGGKQTASVLRKTPAGTQTSAELGGGGHRDPLCKPSDTTLVTRGKALLQKAIGSQSNTCGGSSILASARSWGVKIMHMDEMFSYVQWLDSKRRRSVRQMKLFPSGSRSTVKVMRLRSPFLKVEDESRQLRPLLQKFQDFPELCFLAQRRESPFDPPRPPTSSKAPDAPTAHSDLPFDCCLVPKRRRGYCECCEESFAELQTHLQSPRHAAFVLDASHYAMVDSLISQMTNDFADSSSWSLPPRVPPAAEGDLAGFREDVLEGAAAFSGPSERYSIFGEGSAEPSVSPGSSARLLENQSFWQQQKEFPQETLSSPALLATQSPHSASCRTGGSSRDEQPRRGGGVAEATPEGGSWATSRQKDLWVPPTLLPPQPRKRKRSTSPCGQAKKRPPSSPPPGSTTHPGFPPVGTPERPFPHEGSIQTDPGCLQLLAVPVANPHLLQGCAPFPQGSSCWFPRGHTVTGPGCLQQLQQREKPADHPDQERHAWTLGKCLGMDAELSTPESPTNRRMPPRQLDAVLQPCFPDVFLEQSGPGLLPVSCSEAPSSSESEWDGPLFCARAGASPLPFKPPIDSALLGTRISLHDSSYESHLVSVLWQSLEPQEGGTGDSNSCLSRTEAEWTPFNVLGACQDRLGPFFRNAPAATLPS